MIIVIGHLIVRADERDDFVHRSAEAVRLARGTEGCVDFAVSADAVDPTRVNVSERWSDRDSLERFRGEGPDDQSAATVESFDVAEYEVPEGH